MRFPWSKIRFLWYGGRITTMWTLSMMQFMWIKFSSTSNQLSENYFSQRCIFCSCFFLGLQELSRNSRSWTWSSNWCVQDPSVAKRQTHWGVLWDGNKWRGFYLPSSQSDKETRCSADCQRPLQRQEKRSAQVTEKSRSQRVFHSDPAPSIFRQH